MLSPLAPSTCTPWTLVAGPSVLPVNYLIVMKDMTPDQVADQLSAIKQKIIDDFRDATHMPADFGLTLRDV